MDSTASNSQPPAAPLAQKVSKSRRRLQPRGQAILDEYLGKHPTFTDMPSIKDRKELLKRIKLVPDCEFYDSNNINQWFKRNIEKHVKKTPTIIESTDGQETLDPKFSSLTRPALNHLKVLVSNQPNPSADLVRTWADLLQDKGATHADVVAWIAYFQELLRQRVGTPAPISLPTPADTATPEPSMSPRSSMALNSALKPDPGHSPTVPPLIIRQYYPPEAHDESLLSPATPHTSTSVSSAETPVFPNRAGPMQAIIDGVTEAFKDQSALQQATHTPTTPDEFEAMFAPYEKKLVYLLEVLES